MPRRLYGDNSSEACFWMEALFEWGGSVGCVARISRGRVDYLRLCDHARGGRAASEFQLSGNCRMRDLSSQPPSGWGAPWKHVECASNRKAQLSCAVCLGYTSVFVWSAPGALRSRTRISGVPCAAKKWIASSRGSIEQCSRNARIATALVIERSFVL